jgi:multiple sugar transport system substrate-binding protein
VVTRYGRPWASRNGAELKVVGFDPQAAPPAESATDVWIIPPAALAAWAAAGKLLPVPDAYTRLRDSPYAWDNLLPLFREKLCVWDRTVYGLPLLGEVPLCFYRQDLLDDPRHRADFAAKHRRPLARPATWDEYADIAEFFRERAGVTGPTPSLPPLPASGADLDREFYSVAAPFVRRAVPEREENATDVELFSFHFDLDSGRARIDTPGFVHALRLLQRLQACRLGGAAALPQEAFRNGQAVLCLTDPTWIGRFSAEGSPVKGRFGMCRVPGSRYYFDYQTGQRQVAVEVNFLPYLGAGGWLAVVPRTAPEPEAAFDLLAELSGPRTSLEVVIEPRWGGGVFRRDHFDFKNRGGWNSFGLPPKQTDSVLLDVAQTVDNPGQVKNPVVRLRTPDESAYQEALVAEVRACLTQGTDPVEALRAVRQRWEQLGRRKDPKQRLREYHLSLSLQPK